MVAGCIQAATAAASVAAFIATICSLTSVPHLTTSVEANQDKGNQGQTIYSNTEVEEIQ